MERYENEKLKKEGYKKVYWRRRETRFSNGGEGIQERFKWRRNQCRFGLWGRRDPRKGQEKEEEG